MCNEQNGKALAISPLIQKHIWLVCLSFTFPIAALQCLTEATYRRRGRLPSPQSLRGSQPSEAGKAWWPEGLFTVFGFRFCVCVHVHAHAVYMFTCMQAHKYVGAHVSICTRRPDIDGKHPSCPHSLPPYFETRPLT